MPIIINGITIGTIGADMNVEEITEDIANIKLYDTGYAYWVNKDFDYIIHPIKAANVTLDQSMKSFEDIISSILTSIEAIEKLQKGLDTVNSDKDDAILAIQNISSITEETAASTEELSASMEEQAATMDTISGNTDNLAQTIEKLKDLVNRFKL